MISNEELKQFFDNMSEVFYTNVEGDGYKYQLMVVSDVFVGKSRVSREQWVYAQIQEMITSGKLHAITMKTLTKDEWDTLNG